MSSVPITSTFHNLLILWILPIKNNVNSHQNKIAKKLVYTFVPCFFYHRTRNKILRSRMHNAAVTHNYILQPPFISSAYGIVQIRKKIIIVIKKWSFQPLLQNGMRPYKPLDGRRSEIGIADGPGSSDFCLSVCVPVHWARDANPQSKSKHDCGISLFKISLSHNHSQQE